MITDVNEMSTYSTDSTDSMYSTDPETFFPNESSSSHIDLSARTEKKVPQLSASESEGNVLPSDGRNILQSSHEIPRNVPQSSESSSTLSNSEVVLLRKEGELRTQLAGTCVLTSHVL